MNRERRLACIIERNAHGASASARNDLQQTNVNAISSENGHSVTTMPVLSDRADHENVGSENRCMTSEIGGGTAETLAIWEKVPKNFTQRHGFWPF